MRAPRSGLQPAENHRLRRLAPPRVHRFRARLRLFGRPSVARRPVTRHPDPQPRIAPMYRCTDVPSQCDGSNHEQDRTAVRRRLAEAIVQGRQDTAQCRQPVIRVPSAVIDPETADVGAAPPPGVPNDVCRRSEMSEILRFVTDAHTDADTRCDRILSRARSLDRPMRIARRDSGAHGCAYPIPEALPIRFRRRSAAIRSPGSVPRRRNFRHCPPADRSGLRPGSS